MGGGPELDEARGHHGEVGHHVIGPQEGMEGLHDFPDLAGLEGQLLIDLLAFLIPAPGVFEGANLAGGVSAVLFVEEGVVVLGGVEGRVEIDEIDSLVFEVAAENVEVVAVIKRAQAPRLENWRRLGQCLFQTAKYLSEAHGHDWQHDVGHEPTQFFYGANGSGRRP